MTTSIVPVFCLDPKLNAAKSQQQITPEDAIRIPGRKSAFSSFIRKAAEISSKLKKSRSFLCKICGHAFSQQGTLKRHARIHTGERPFQCLVCSTSFTHRGSLIRHARVHTGEKPYGCEICGRHFSHRCALQTHHRVHTGEKPFSCPFCQKCFSDRSTQRRHSRNHMKPSAKTMRSLEMFTSHFIQQ